MPSNSLAASALRRAWIMKTTTCVVTRCPQPGSGPARSLAPAGLVGVLDGLRIVVAPRVLDRLGNGSTRGLLTSNDRADRHLQSENVAHQLGDLALGQSVNPHQDCDDGIHGRAKCARGDAHWQLTHGSMAAQTAAKRVLLILGDNGLDGR